MNLTQKVTRQGVTGWTASFYRKGTITLQWLVCLWVPEESGLPESDTLQAGTQRMATNKSHGGPLGGM